ncbi:LSU ribosomal protein L5p (L11e) [hydrothermal vent metagenome]|uniref:LSU ribosomal protein L5p (L11e) n=1 Tax=hydrothermal vent metagenome TaxID=652676 RepID=A0A1W1BKH9_9ZZZZ
MSRLKKYYKEEVVPKLQKELSFSSSMAVPRIEKITINMGLGDALGDKKILEKAMGDMALITGQQPVVCKARKSVASFKLREGWPVGCKVTLRKEKMFEFIDRLISIALPRVRDFRGLNPKSFDSKGNYSLGITEQIVFPEIDYEKIDKIRGMDICITTTAKTDSDAKKLLEAFNFPFKK